jgi:hypothetical protein
VLRHYPQFAGWQPLKRMARDASADGLREPAAPEPPAAVVPRLSGA